MYLMLGIASIVFLAHDIYAGQQERASKRVKLVYAALLLLSAYHLLIFKGWIFFYSYYDTAILIFGNTAEYILAYLTPKG